MTVTMQRLVGQLAWHLRPHRHGRVPVRWCEYAGHTYPKAAVDRDRNGVDFCPGCGRRIKAEPLMNGKVRIPPHRRRSSVGVAVVKVVDR